MKRLIHWIRKHIWGECPFCFSTDIKEVPGWPKLECKKCGRSWTYMG